MNNQLNEQFEVVVKKYKEATLDKCSAGELKQYHAFLLEHGAINGFNEAQYQQLCNYIRILLALKKPHWTVLPTFWLALVSASASVIGIIIALYLRPQTTISSSQQNVKELIMQPAKQPENQQNIIKPILLQNSSNLTSIRQAKEAK